MRGTLLILLMALFLLPLTLPAQNESLTASNLSSFLDRYQKDLEAADQAYTELSNENLPLLDENGQPLGRHHLEDRRQTLIGLRDIARRLAASPGDLVLATTLFARNEALVDDVFDLSQVAYENDREELGKRLSDLEAALDYHDGLIENYVLSLAASQQQRMQELERENSDLRLKLKEALEKGKASRP